MKLSFLDREHPVRCILNGALIGGLWAIALIFASGGCSKKPQHVPATRDAWFVTDDGNIIHGTIYKVREERFLKEFEYPEEAISYSRKTASTQLENNFDEIDIQIEIDKGEKQWQK